jgi:hypothetical protein
VEMVMVVVVVVKWYHHHFFPPHSIVCLMPSCFTLGLLYIHMDMIHSCSLTLG